MKKGFKKFLVCFIAFTAVFLLTQSSVMAYNKVNTANIHLSKSTNYDYVEFIMPKDGKVKVNVKVKDTDIVPGSLTVTFQKGHLETAEKVKEITGIMTDSPITDYEVELSKGKYYISYKLTNETGDLTYSSLALKCIVEILPTIPVNIPELTVNSINSLEEITKSEYDELKFGDEDMNLVIPFTVKNGDGVYISMGKKDGGFNTIKGTIYKDEECETAVGESFTLKSGDGYADFARALLGSGTYYIKFTMDSYSYAPVGETPFLVKLYDLNGDDRTITKGKPTLAYQDKESKKISYKITVKTKSTLGVKMTPLDNSKGETATFSLLDKDKKVISKNSKFSSQKEDDSNKYLPVEKVYTVPAGTYYIQVTASSNLYQLKYNYYKVKQDAGSSKSKAKLLKIQQDTAQGYLTFADKKSKVCWYKFTVTSKQFVQLYMEYFLDGELELEILNSKGKVLYKLSEELGSSEGSIITWCGKYYNKGTYYIKVYKKGSKSSATYRFGLFDYAYKGSN